MIQVSVAQVPSTVRALFDPTMPASMRCFAVLDGVTAGRVLTDDPASPCWAILQEAAFGTIYLGGSLDAALLARSVDELRQDSDVLFGFWPDDPRRGILPPQPDYEGSVFDCTDRPVGQGLDGFLRLPAGCHLQRITPALFQRCDGFELALTAFGSLEAALEHGLGFCLMQGGEILSEAFAGPVALGLIEMGTATPEAHRRRGYATITCAHLIRECEERGYRTYWNCARQNEASVALARKLGYRTVQEYRLVAWFRR